jgi:hypothetical protein
MTVDLVPAIQAIASLILAGAVSAAVGIAQVLYRKTMHRDLTATQIQQVRDACVQGANVAYGLMATDGNNLSSVPVRNAALALGVRHVLASVPDALVAAGITPEAVSAMVTARFGGLLAADSTVRLTTPIGPPNLAVVTPLPPAAKA